MLVDEGGISSFVVTRRVMGVRKDELKKGQVEQVDDKEGPGCMVE